MAAAFARVLISTAALATIAALCATAHAGGPLTPPGAPTETPGPEPRIPINDLPGDPTALHVITEPGSYYLSENIESTTPGVHGVKIATPGPVSIDGMGFAMIGGPETHDAFHVFDDTGVPLRATITKVSIRGWDSVLTKSTGKGSSNAPDEDYLVFTVWDYNGEGAASGGIVWDGNIIVADAVVDELQGVVILCNDGSVRVVRTSISRSGGRAIDVTGDFIGEDLVIRSTGGVMATGKMVLKGSKILENFTGVALDVGADAKILGNTIDGAVISGQYLTFHDNVHFANLDDPSWQSSVFGDGLHSIVGNHFNIKGTNTSNLPAVQVLGDDVEFAHNTVKPVDLVGGPTRALPVALEYIVLFTVRSHVHHNTISGVAAGIAGMTLDGAGHEVHDNFFSGVGIDTVGLQGSAADSLIHRNRFTGIDVPIDLTGTGNYIGAVLDPSTAATNPTPDRNLRIPVSSAPVR